MEWKRGTCRIEDERRIMAGFAGRVVEKRALGVFNPLLTVHGCGVSSMDGSFCFQSSDHI